MSDSPWKINLVRSAGRVKTAGARLVGNVVEVRVPEGLTPEQERQLVDKMVARLRARTSGTHRGSNEELGRRAEELNVKYFQGRLRVNSIRYVTNQNTRFGSCTPSTRDIRLSHRLAAMPDWVRDYVLIHELAHLLEANHSPAFWKLVRRYPLAERAIGFLMASGMGDEGEVEGRTDATGDPQAKLDPSGPGGEGQ